MYKICFAPGQFEISWEYGELDFRKYSCMCFQLESVGKFRVFSVLKYILGMFLVEC